MLIVPRDMTTAPAPAPVNVPDQVTPAPPVGSRTAPAATVIAPPALVPPPAITSVPVLVIPPAPVIRPVVQVVLPLRVSGPPALSVPALRENEPSISDGAATASEPLTTSASLETRLCTASLPVMVTVGEAPARSM